MKRVLLIINIVIIAFLLFVIYEQHQLLNKYRGTVYSSLSQLNLPVERILSYHENKDYTEDTNQRLLITLDQYYGDIFNNGGWGFLLESDMKEKYYNKYLDTRVSYSLAIQKYIEANTEDERQQAYNTIKSKYENYSEFLEKARKELDLE